VFEDKKPDQPAKLFVMEVGRDKSAPGGVFRVTPQNIPVPPDATNDFPVAMNVSKKYDMIYIISKMGYLYLFDIFSGKPIYRARITQDTVFVSAEHTSSGGLLGITRRGQVLHVGINEQCLVPYIVGQLRDQELAIQIASRLNLSGADDLYVAQFQNLVAAGDVAGRLHALQNVYGGGSLRNPLAFRRRPGCC
jgi:clathrin heavy chain